MNVICSPDKVGVANYRAEKPIAKAFMTDVVFDMDNMVSTTEPGQLEVTNIVNHGGAQTVTRDIEYTSSGFGPRSCTSSYVEERRTRSRSTN